MRTGLAGLCGVASLWSADVSQAALAQDPLVQDTLPSLGNYAIKHWTTQDGLPQNSIRDISQGPDGRMWFATWEGLVSYDGLNFHIQNRGSDPPLPDNGIGALVTDAAGDMWFSDARGDIGRHDIDGSWHFWPHESSAPATLIQSMKIDRKGDVWLLYENHGLGTMSHSGVFHYNAPGPNQPLSTVYRNMAFDSSDALWVGTYSGIVIREANGHVHQPPASWNLPHGLSWPYHAPDGTFWVVSDSRIFSIVDNRPELAYDLRNHGRVTALLQDRHKALWVGTEDHGLIRLSGDRIETMPDTLDPAAGRILSLAEDREGSIWVGTSAGLFRLQETPFSAIRRHNGLAGDFVRTVMEDHANNLWVGTDGGLSEIIGDGPPQTWPLPTRSGHQPEVLASVEARDGTVWLGTYADGLFGILADGTIRHLDAGNGLPPGNIRALAFDAAGQLLIGTQHGLYTLDDTGQVHHVAVRNPPSGLITALYVEGDRIWVGTLDGVRIIHEGNTQALKFHGLDGAHTIFGFLPIGTDLWFTSDRGLYRYRHGKTAHVGRAAGLPVDSVFALAQDHDGYVWATSNRGIFRILLTDLEKAADGAQHHLSLIQLDESNGLSSSQASGSAQPSIALRRDGSLWIATAIGIARTEPARFNDFLIKPPPPPVALDGIAVDGRDIRYVRRGGVLHVPSRHNLTIRYTAPSYIAPAEIIFRTTIKGSGASWTTTGKARTLELTSLPPGRYTLSTAAAHPGQAWPQPVTLVDFVIDPKWWQRRRFWVFCTLMLGGLIGLSYGAIVWRYRVEARKLSRIIERRTRDLQAQTTRLEQADMEKDALLARLNIQMELTAKQAREDALTGVYNRRAFDEAVETMLSGVRDGGPEFCLAIIDIDHFKAINDNHSHQSGDQVLREVASLLKAGTHAADMVARIGGEEFGVLLPAQSLQAAQARLESLREDFHGKSEWEIPALEGGVTFSAGLTRFEPGDTVKSLLKRADKLLYGAKHAGRDRIHVA
ncbi:diguanylate cyclase [Asaia krungthepensis NRIC 0535]|uniref:diguanylate cyclase n=1 Tax=Asaia krungthepensis NRIC 0535 TaxID=1307925 RepID=A0ABQ0Q1X4_9PROT|nr:diguanylate cyclase [Asaia krungthepensis NRIC 0535]